MAYKNLSDALQMNVEARSLIGHAFVHETVFQASFGGLVKLSSRLNEPEFTELGAKLIDMYYLEDGRTVRLSYTVHPNTLNERAIREAFKTSTLKFSDEAVLVISYLSGTPKDVEVHVTSGWTLSEWLSGGLMLDSPLIPNNRRILDAHN